MRRYRRRGGGGGGWLVLLILPLLIYALDFGIRMMDGQRRTGGLADGTVSLLELCVGFLIAVAAGWGFWHWNRGAAILFGVVCGFAGWYFIQVIADVYFCQAALECR